MSAPIFIVFLPLLAAIVAGCVERGALRRNVHPLLGVQLFSVATEAAADLNGTLTTLAAIGYRRVELAGYMGRTPGQLRAALDHAGLQCVSAHVPPMPIFGPSRTLEPPCYTSGSVSSVAGGAAPRARRTRIM